MLIGRGLALNLWNTFQDTMLARYHGRIEIRGPLRRIAAISLARARRGSWPLRVLRADQRETQKNHLGASFLGFFRQFAEDAIEQTALLGK